MQIMATYFLLQTRYLYITYALRSSDKKAACLKIVCLWKNETFVTLALLDTIVLSNSHDEVGHSVVSRIYVGRILTFLLGIEWNTKCRYWLLQKVLTIEWKVKRKDNYYLHKQCGLTWILLLCNRIGAG